MVHKPHVCPITPQELLEFCREAGYSCRLEPRGTLLIPPDHNVGLTDWERSLRLRCAPGRAYFPYGLLSGGARAWIAATGGAWRICGASFGPTSPTGQLGGQLHVLTVCAPRRGALFWSHMEGCWAARPVLSVGTQAH